MVPLFRWIKFTGIVDVMKGVDEFVRVGYLQRTQTQMRIRNHVTGIK